jgi:hypothetical protein
LEIFGGSLTAFGLATLPPSSLLLLDEEEEEVRRRLRYFDRYLFNFDLFKYQHSSVAIQ